MDRYWQANVATDPPVTPSENPGGFPANGTPAVGIPGTVPGEWWYHAITEELRNAIVALGASPDFTQTNQLAQSLLSALAHLAVSINYEDLIGKPALAAVATSGAYDDLSGTPPPFELLPATTATLGGVIAGPGTTIAADGTLSALGAVRTVNHQAPDAQGNTTVQAMNAAAIAPGQVSLINNGGATSGEVLFKSLKNGKGVALADLSNTVEIDAQLSADTGNSIRLGSDNGLFVSVSGPAPVCDLVTYLHANGMPVTKNVAWGMGGPSLDALAANKVAMGAAVTVGTEPFTLFTVAAGTYDIEMQQNWLWLSGVTTGVGAGCSINLMKFTLAADLTTVTAITSVGVFQNLFSNANTAQQVVQRSVFRDIVMGADPLTQYGIVGQFVNGLANQTASLPTFASSVNPSAGNVVNQYTNAGLMVRFTPKF